MQLDLFRGDEAAVQVILVMTLTRPLVHAIQLAGLSLVQWSHPISSEQLFARGLAFFREFSTVRAGNAVCPLGVLGYYEVEILHTESCTKFGFCSSGWLAKTGDSGEGVGDDCLSWGVDGDLALKWHAGESLPFGGRWRAGDVVGLACDLRARRMLVSLNGDFSPPYGATFDLPAAGLEGGMCPALSARSGLYRCNMGGWPAGLPFRHPPPTPEYRSMAAAGLTA